MYCSKLERKTIEDPQFPLILLFVVYNGSAIVLFF